MIEFRGVTKRYADGTDAVRDLDLTLPSAAISVLVGSSGCGKTTCLRMINRMVEPTTGEVLIDGSPVSATPEHQLRRGIGYVIQSGGLFPHRTVADNIATVPKLLGWSKPQIADRTSDLLDLVGLDATMAKRYPHQLSGGQQQRVGVARALAADPPVLLMDEPFGAVDPVVRAQLQVELRALQQQVRKTIVFVTHDIDEAIALGDHLVVLSTGAVVEQQGSPAALLARPENDFVRSFLGDDRTLRSMSLQPALMVSVHPLPTDAHGGWRLVGLQWHHDDGRIVSAPNIDAHGSIRSLIDASIASPTGMVVRLNADGNPAGVSTFDDAQRAARAIVDAIATRS
jgi:osmoprotectant transport system ATP-binding protein